MITFTLYLKSVFLGHLNEQGRKVSHALRVIINKPPPHITNCVCAHALILSASTMLHQVANFSLQKVHSALKDLQEQFGEEIVPSRIAQDLKKIKQILEQKDISISVFGKHNCGKSTLLNVLLGDE